MQSWHSMCPSCGENVFTGVKNNFIAYCNKCKTTWTMTELEIYDLSHPSKEVIDIVNKMKKLSFELDLLWRNNVRK